MKPGLAFMGMALLMTIALGGCRTAMRDDPPASDFEDNARRVERQIKEDRTRSSLAKIESSIADYVHAEHKIPANLDILIPRYLAEIPTVELGLRGFRDNNAVTIYPPTIMRAGRIDGTRIKNTGHWGYVFNDAQLILFVDCTRQMSTGQPWYTLRGVY